VRFYVDKLGFELAEDKRLGDYRWVVIRLPDNKELTINLEIARTDEEAALVSKGLETAETALRRLGAG
jgi:hypothetical protein